MDKRIEQLYREMYELLYAYAYSSLQNYMQAEDAVQDTFYIACTKKKEFLSSQNERGWLMNTLKFVIHNAWRKNAKTAALEDYAAVNGEQAVCDEIDIDILYGDLAEGEDYKLLRRIAVEYYTIAELADMLGISVEACKKRVQRARKRLRKQLQERN